MGTIIRYLQREIEKLIILSILHFWTIHKNYPVLHSVAFPPQHSKYYTRMGVSSAHISPAQHLHGGCHILFSSAKFISDRFSIKRHLLLPLLLRTASQSEKKCPQPIILMVLKLFITLLWAWVLKLQFFTTVRKTGNLIPMQFIIETDICINLTFV